MDPLAVDGMFDLLSPRSGSMALVAVPALSPAERALVASVPRSLVFDSEDWPFPDWPFPDRSFAVWDPFLDIGPF